MDVALTAIATGALVVGSLRQAGRVELARYVVAFWGSDGLWDVGQIPWDKVVPGTAAEWRGVLDVLVALGLLASR